MQCHIYGIAVKVSLPYMREQPVTTIDDEPVNLKDKRGTEQIGCKKMDVADIVHRHAGESRL